jgi:predicted patatin/cPLA2 family phospholipase
MTRTRSYRKGPTRFLWAVKKMFPQYPELIRSMADRHVRYNRTRDWIFEQERLGKAYIFAPHRMPLGNGTRSLKVLTETYEAGLRQAREEMPRIRRFLGI